jgi:NAD(P) transhydrogenase subunit alpha
MPVKIAVLKESRPNERRVAMVPAVADKLVKLGESMHGDLAFRHALKIPV